VTDTGSDTATVLADRARLIHFRRLRRVGTFGANVTFACSGLPALTSGGVGAGCEFNPATIAAGPRDDCGDVTVWTCGPNLPTDCAAGAGGMCGGHRRRRCGAGSGGRASANLAFLRTRLVHVCGLVGWRERDPVRCVLYWDAGVCAAIGLLALISCGGLSSNTTTTTPVTVNPGWRLYSRVNRATRGRRERISNSSQQTRA